MARKRKNKGFVNKEVNKPKVDTPIIEKEEAKVVKTLPAAQLDLLRVSARTLNKDVYSLPHFFSNLITQAINLAGGDKKEWLKPMTIAPEESTKLAPSDIKTNVEALIDAFKTLLESIGNLTVTDIDGMVGVIDQADLSKEKDGVGFIVIDPNHTYIDGEDAAQLYRNLHSLKAKYEQRWADLTDKFANVITNNPKFGHDLISQILRDLHDDLQIGIVAHNRLFKALTEWVEWYAQTIAGYTILPTGGPTSGEEFIAPLTGLLTYFDGVINPDVKETDPDNILFDWVGSENIDYIDGRDLETVTEIINKPILQGADRVAGTVSEVVTPPPVETPTVGSLTGDTTASTTDGAGTFNITVDYGTTDGTTPATGSVSTDDTNWTCTDTVCTATTGATTGNIVITATSSNGLTIPTLTVAVSNTDTPVDSSTPATLTAGTTMDATNGIGAISYTLTEGLLADGITPSATTIALTSSGSATGTCDAGSCSVTGAVDAEVITLTATTNTPKGVTGSPAEVTVSNTVLFPVENIQINGDSSATITGTAGAATGTYTINVTDGGQDASGEIISATYNPTAIAATTGTGTMTLGTKNINTTTGVGTVTYDITNATVGDVFTLNKEDIVSATLGNGTTGTDSGVSVTITPDPIVVTITAAKTLPENKEIEETSKETEVEDILEI